MISIRYKAIMPVGILAIMLAGTSWVSKVGLNDLQTTTHGLVERFHEIEEVRQIEAEVSKLIYVLFNVASTGSEESRQTAHDILKKVNERIHELRDMQVVNEEEQDLLDDVSDAIDDVTTTAAPLFDGSRDANLAKNVDLVTDLSDQLAALTKRLNSWHKSEIREVDELSEQAETLPRYIGDVATWIGGVALVILLLALWVNTRILVRPILKISKSTQVLASGNFDHAVDINTNDEIGSLAGDINNMAGNLNQMHRRLSQLANTDALTGLMNRRAFETIAASEIALATRHKRSLAIAIFDIDHFKDVNDKYGHAAGDAVLQFVALTVAGALRRSDYLFRLGGEEFVIILRDAASPGVHASLDRCRETIAVAPCVTGEQMIPVTASFGFALLGEHGDDVDTLLAHADSALYQAKQSGRNRTFAYDASASRTTAE